MTLLATHTAGQRYPTSAYCSRLTATDPSITTVYESALRNFDGHRSISNCNLLNVDPSILYPTCLFSTTALRPFQIERVYRPVLLINRPPLCIPEGKRCDPPTQTVRPIAARPVHNIPPESWNLSIRGLPKILTNILNTGFNSLKDCLASSQSRAMFQ